MESLCLLEATYNVFLISANRSVPVAIAVYRYCCVFHSNWLLSAVNRKNLEMMIIAYMAGQNQGGFPYPSINQIYSKFIFIFIKISTVHPVFAPIMHIRDLERSLI